MGFVQAWNQVIPPENAGYAYRAPINFDAILARSAILLK